MRGAGSTIASVMPVSTVMNGGIGTPGFTSVSNVPRHSPPRHLTAPTSVIAQSFGEPPVVSRSSTTNVTSRERGAEVVEASAAPATRTSFEVGEQAFGDQAVPGMPRRTIAAVSRPAYRCTACGNLTRFDVT